MTSTTTQNITIGNIQQNAHVFTSMTTPLISIGTLCDQGCIATFDANKISITKHNNQIATGPRNHQTGLWDLHFTHANINKANHITPTKNMQDMIQYLHASCFFPVKSTWLDVIGKGFFKTWPGVTTQNVTKYLLKNEFIERGHMRQKFKNFQSNKKKPYHKQHLPTNK